MNDVASKTNQLSTDASGAVNVASANVETVAAAAEELSKSIQEIGQKVDSSQGIARHAVTAAERTHATVPRLVNATTTVRDAARSAERRVGNKSGSTVTCRG